jgi:tripartite-type tricarboxylate transporter receptor subunit TctC
MKLPRRQFLHLAAGAAALPAVARIARAQTYPLRPITMVVPYSAGGPTDTIARIMAERMKGSLGQIILVENVTGAAGTIGVGRVARAAPDIPTVDEAGVPGLHISIWHALWTPKGTSKDIIAKLNGAVVDALADAVVRQRLADLGQEIPPREQLNPQTLAAYHKAEIEKWWPILKAANIKGE